MTNNRNHERSEIAQSSAQLQSNDRWGVILLCHGSQRGTSAAECSCAWETNENSNLRLPYWCKNCPSTPKGLKDAVSLLGIELGAANAEVILSCLEFIEPHPDEAVRILTNRGFNKLVIMPYLLGHGKHATLELDEVLEELKNQAPTADIFLSEGFGSDEKLASLVVERIQSLQSSNSYTPTNEHPAGILLVKAGTKTQYDDCSWMVELGQIVENRLGSNYAVSIAQSHYGDPTMDAAAANLVDKRNVGSIMCVPYLFFPGLILQRNVIGGLEKLRNEYPDIPIRVTPPLGVDSRLVSVAADRIREVWSR